MNDQRIDKNTPTKTDWDRFHSMTDDEINQAATSDPDAQPTDAVFWEDARQVFPVADEETINWFKESYGDGYRKKISAVLREFMENNTTS